MALVGCRKVAPGHIRDHGTLLESRETPYNNVYVFRSGNNVSMTFGFNDNIYTESVYNTADERDLPVPYTRYMTAALVYPPAVRSVLEIGSGGGRMAWYIHLHMPDVQVTSVELDPGVMDLAQKYFGIKEEKNFRLVTRDGRMFLADSKEKYDVILIDAYRGPFVPFHLLTQEFYQLVKEHLENGGVIAQNIEPSTMLFDSAVTTVNSVFPNVDFYEGSGDGQSALTGQDVGGNVVLVAFRFKPEDLSHVAAESQRRFAFRYDIAKMVNDYRYELRPVVVNGQSYLDVFNKDGVATGGIDKAAAKLLTDDFAPVDSLKAIARHNERWTRNNQDVPLRH
jgi:spermidine synthase